MKIISDIFLRIFSPIQNPINVGSNKQIDSNDSSLFICPWLKYAIKNGYQITIHLAGNGKMLPSQIPVFLKQLINKKIDFVSGSRFLKKGDYKSNPLIRIVLIKILSFTISLLYKKK